MALLVVYTNLSTGQPAEQKIAGDIVSVQGDRMELRAADGRMLTLGVPGDVRLSARSPADPSQLQDGAFVGTMAIAQADGTLVAREVHIFPESMRGRGEGHRAMDNEPGSTMTNATVSRMRTGAGSSTMTNATVANVAGAGGGRSLTLTYKGGEKTLLVPENTPIVMVENADRSQLAQGAHVVAYATAHPDGTLSATRITVGLKGLVPPL
jgi:hypothetical protein